MGCGGSQSDKKQEQKQNGEQPQTTVPQTQEVKNQEDLNIGQNLIVNEKFGKIHQDYTLLKEPLGKGAFGEVRKAIHQQSGATRAVKIINKNEIPDDELEKLQNEVEILKKLDHPNIIQVFEFYQDSKNFFIVTELCTGGELFDQIIEDGTFSEQQGAEAMKQILAAVNYCHKNNIVHRDLKPENILYDSNKPGAIMKIVDFGTSISWENQSTLLNQKLGTPYYIAPEVLDQKYDEKCDIWSCGVILYILLCGKPPFDGETDNNIMDKVKTGKVSYDGEEWLVISEEAKRLVKQMLCQNKDQRYSAEQCLNDPWIQSNCEQNDVDPQLLQKSLENMKTFRAGKKLQEATWLFIVNFLATKEEKNQLLQVFQALDTNNDGILSREELIAGYQNMGNPEPQAQVQKILKIVDKNNSGCIDYTEWVMATINRENLLSKQKLETTFRMFDKDGSGTISIDEIQQMFGGSGGTVAESVWQDIIKEVGGDINGNISYTQFKDMMLKMIEIQNNTKIPPPPPGSTANGSQNAG